MNFTPFGGANEVGASCALIEIDEKRILVDAGIRMNGKPDEQLPDLEALWEAGLPHAVLLTHAHTDHTGALPELEKILPGDVKVYCTAPTMDITRVLLNNAAGLSAESDYRDRVSYALHRMKRVGFNQQIDICEGVTATWVPAGHILGAAMIHIQGKQESVLMTGDVSGANQLTIPGMDSPPLQPDVMVMESTYGNCDHVDIREGRRSLVSDVIEHGGKVLLPVFAVGRAQEVILILKNAMERGEISKLPVYVDGMVRDINRVYANHGKFLSPSLQRQLKRVKRGEDIFYSDNISKVSSCSARNSILSGPPCCIVAPSGMLVGGRSVWYTKRLAGNPANLIGLTGYQAEGNAGGELEKLIVEEDPEKRVVYLPADEDKDGVKVTSQTPIRVPVQVKCEIRKYSLSAHADRDQLTSLVEKVQPRKLFLVHGNDAAREELAKSIHAKCPNVHVQLPENGVTYTVDKHSGIAQGRQLPNDRLIAKVFAFILEKGLKGPFHVSELAEIGYGAAATTPTTMSFFRWCLWLDTQFFKRGSDDLFYLRHPA